MIPALNQHRRLLRLTVHGLALQATRPSGRAHNVTVGIERLIAHEVLGEDFDHVFEFALAGSDGGIATCRARLRPWSRYLALRVNNRLPSGSGAPGAAPL